MRFEEGRRLERTGAASDVYSPRIARRRDPPANYPDRGRVGARGFHKPGRCVTSRARLLEINETSRLTRSVMRVPWSSVALCIAAITAGCGKHVPEPAPHPNAPHVSWEIKTG